MRMIRTKLIQAGVALGFLLTMGAGHAVEPAAWGGAPVTVQMTEDGPVLATASGMTLYTWTQEDSSPGKALCANKRYTEGRDPFSNVVPFPNAEHRRTCIDKWRPLLADAKAAPQGPWSLVKRDDGALQWAYERHPLYSSIKDRAPGDVNGQGYTRLGFIGGWRPAFAPLGFPPGVKLVRQPEGLVLATGDGRPLFLRHGPQRICDGCADELEPLRAAAVAHVQGDWSVLEIGNGRRQFAYKGRALFVSPLGMEGRELGAGWAPAVWRRSAGHPTEFSTRFTVIGDVYTTKEGMALYVFSCGSFTGDALSCDDPGDAAAYWALHCGKAEVCAKLWRLVRAPKAARPVGDWSVVDVAVPLYGDTTGSTYLPAEAPSRVKAWAWRGRPLYTFADDGEPGQVLGHGRENATGSGFNAIIVPGSEVQR